MKITPFLLALAIPGISSFAQQKYFEGNIVYKVSMRSKMEKISDKDVHKMLAEGDQVTVAIKNGNYRRTSEYSDNFLIYKDQRSYVKFKSIDTLYYLDYASDPVEVTGITKADSVFTINHYRCKVITLPTKYATYRYYYTDSLRNNPIYDTGMVYSIYGPYSRATGGAVYLWSRSELAFASQTDSCIRIEQKSIDDHVFDLPALPRKKLSVLSLISRARFPGKEGAWLSYLQSNLDAKLAAKYVKLAKNQQEAADTVLVEYLIAENGSLSDIKVVNKDKVPSRLAEEAMRVIQESPRWVPANYFGQKITSLWQQPVVFKIMR